VQTLTGDEIAARVAELARITPLRARAAPQRV
jgi:hypothetical protein